MDHIEGTLGLGRPLREPWPAFDVSVASLCRRRQAATRGERMLSVSRISIGRAGHRERESFFAAVAQGDERGLECRVAADPGETEASADAARLCSAFEKGDGAFREAADRLFGRDRQGLEALFPIERRRAIAEVSPPPGPRGAALARWQAALKAQAGGLDVRSLADAVQAARQAGLTPDSLPDIAVLRRLARQAAWDFSEEGAPRLARFCALLRAAERCGLRLEMWELQACALEGLRRLREEWSLPVLQELVSQKAFEQEAQEIVAALGLSPAVWLNAPAQERAAASGEAP
jgi:hypothetical protein